MNTEVKGDGFADFFGNADEVVGIALPFDKVGVALRPVDRPVDGILPAPAVAGVDGRTRAFGAVPGLAFEVERVFCGKMIRSA
jgi:hypothetical protein